MSSYLDTGMRLGSGRKRSHRGKGILSDLIGSIGLGRRRRHHKKRTTTAHRLPTMIGSRRRRVHRGKGIFDKLKSAAHFALPIVASAVLGKAGSAIGSKLFGGKRRKSRVPKRHTSLSSLIAKLKGGKRRTHRRVGGKRKRAILV